MFYKKRIEVLEERVKRLTALRECEAGIHNGSL